MFSQLRNFDFVGVNKTWLVMARGISHLLGVVLLMTGCQSAGKCGYQVCMIFLGKLMKNSKLMTWDISYNSYWVNSIYVDKTSIRWIGSLLCIYTVLHCHHCHLCAFYNVVAMILWIAKYKLPMYWLISQICTPLNSFSSPNMYQMCWSQCMHVDLWTCLI